MFLKCGEGLAGLAAPAEKSRWRVGGVHVFVREGQFKTLVVLAGRRDAGACEAFACSSTNDNPLGAWGAAALTHGRRSHLCPRTTSLSACWDATALAWEAFSFGMLWKMMSGMMCGMLDGMNRVMNRVVVSLPGVSSCFFFRVSRGLNRGSKTLWGQPFSSLRFDV